jgi:hypothetical protein
MKTQVLAWFCLGAGLWLLCLVGTPPCSDDKQSGPRPREDGYDKSGPVCSSRDSAESACRLARGGKTRDAWRLAMALPAAQRNECLPLVAAIHAATDPLGAWREALSIGESALRLTCQVAVLRSGSDGFLPELAGMADSLPDEVMREAMLREIVSRWALQDPCALSAWPDLAALPASVRDEAARRLVIQGDRLNRSPAVAGAWAEAIEEPELRSVAIEAAAREWFAEEPAAACEFVRRSLRLDDARRASILSALAGQEPP